MVNYYIFEECRIVIHQDTLIDVLVNMLDTLYSGKYIFNLKPGFRLAVSFSLNYPHWRMCTVMVFQRPAISLTYWIAFLLLGSIHGFDVISYTYFTFF